MQLKGFFLSVGVSVCFLFTTALAAPPLQVKVDFDSTGGYQRSDGTNRTSSASGLSAAERQAILAKAQEKFDLALGPGQVVLSEGTGGDMNIIMSGKTSPATTATWAGPACPAWSIRKHSASSADPATCSFSRREAPR